MREEGEGRGERKESQWTKEENGSWGKGRQKRGSAGRRGKERVRGGQTRGGEREETEGERMGREGGEEEGRNGILC